jgi:uncharacterized damage-inducible protein DinB
MNDTLLELYRHKTWATLQLIEFCAKLSDDELAATTPGTYGNVRDTLRHLVGAEQRYYTRVTGGDVDTLAEPGSSLDELAERIRQLGPEWERLAEDEQAARRQVVTKDGWRIPAAVVMAQAIHHADDHRTHVLSVLSAIGIEGPDLDVWSYAEAAGQNAGAVASSTQ